MNGYYFYLSAFPFVVVFILRLFRQRFVLLHYSRYILYRIRWVMRLWTFGVHKQNIFISSPVAVNIFTVFASFISGRVRISPSFSKGMSVSEIAFSSKGALSFPKRSGSCYGKITFFCRQGEIGVYSYSVWVR